MASSSTARAVRAVEHDIELFVQSSAKLFKQRRFLTLLNPMRVAYLFLDIFYIAIQLVILFFFKPVSCFSLSLCSMDNRGGDFEANDVARLTPACAEERGAEKAVWQNCCRRYVTLKSPLLLVILCSCTCHLPYPHSLLGAGLTGISSAAHCISHNFDVVIFECMSAVCRTSSRPHCSPITPTNSHLIVLLLSIGSPWRYLGPCQQNVRFAAQLDAVPFPPVCVVVTRVPAEGRYTRWYVAVLYFLIFRMVVLIYDAP